jgi:hypothetical protein
VAVKNGDVADEDAYQSTTVPAPEVALNVTAPAPHLDPLVTTGAVGTAIFCVIVRLSVEVQPFAAVAVTVYVPAAVMLADAEVPKLLLHAYAEPPVAVTLIAVLEQVNKVDPVLFVILAVGAIIFCVIVMLVVDVQPFNPVAVTV